ncbi:MAG: FitA-like ribbon-helix-helix domain-containing protein [Parvularculaceae bacterium]
MLVVEAMQPMQASAAGPAMPSVTVRHVPEEVHRRLRIRAARNGRSMEAELRQVLALAAGLRPAPVAAPEATEPAKEAESARMPTEVYRKLRDILEVRTPKAAG